MLKAEQEKENFWLDNENVLKVNKKLKFLESKLEKVIFYEKRFLDVKALIELVEIASGKDEAEFYLELNNSIKLLKSDLNKIRLETLLNGKYDNNNAILTIHAGAGGTEAQDWANMLFRMYTMYADKQNFKVKVLSSLDGDEAGIKSITFLVSGENAYGFLKSEKGVHRLVRISPFDSNARRHTSFASVEVMPEITEAPDIVIKPEDLKIDTYRSSGAGGQHVNKTESAIRITHIPTGFVVSCQTERSQIQNRETCMKMLLSKLAQKREEEEIEKLNQIRGELKKIEWGSQIRSYVFHPYTMVKDHRTNYETSDVFAVMDGELEEFISVYLKMSAS